MKCTKKRQLKQTNAKYLVKNMNEENKLRIHTHKIQGV